MREGGLPGAPGSGPGGFMWTHFFIIFHGFSGPVLGRFRVSFWNHFWRHSGGKNRLKIKSKIY